MANNEPNKAEESIVKAESNPGTAITGVKTGRGQPRIVNTAALIWDQRKTDLQMPQRFCTFAQMCEDPDVYTPLTRTIDLAVDGLSQYRLIASRSQSSIAAADFIDYVFNNIPYTTWRQAMRDACNAYRDGFSIANNVFTKAIYGQYAGKFVLGKLSPRSAPSICAWVFDKEETQLLGALQVENIERDNKLLLNKQTYDGRIVYNNTIRTQKSGKVFLSMPQMFHIAYNQINNNPQGDPPLLHCYTAWQEKNIINKYRVIGITKQLGGISVCKVPHNLLSQAANPDLYPDAAAEYDELQQNLAAINSGESSNLILISDYDEQTKTPLYDFKLLGVEGSGGKAYDINEIMLEKRRQIFNTFGAGFLLIGQDSYGGNTISSNGARVHSQTSESLSNQVADQINRQIIPRILAVNGIYLDWKDIPKFVAGSPEKPDLDLVSKTVQRLASVKKLTKEALQKIYDDQGWSTEGIDELDYTSKGSSRAGESLGTSGTGDTQSGGSSSEMNMENGASVTKNYVFDYETEEQIVAVDTTSGNPIFIEK